MKRLDRMLSRRVGRPRIALLTVLLGGCDFWYNRVPSPDDLWHVIPWFDHMIHARYIRPYQSAAVPRYTPAGHRAGHRRRGRLVG